MVRIDEADAVVVRTAPADGAVVQLKAVDAGDLVLTWRWEHAPERPRTTVLPRDAVQPALDALARALPVPGPGESVDDALRRSWRVLGDPGREVALADALARALVPFALAQELNGLLLRGIRPHARIQPSPSLAHVPWEALRVDEGERFVHGAEVSTLPPAGIRHASSRPSAADPPLGGGTVVAVVDPLVPGPPPGLGAVLGGARGRLDAALARQGARLAGTAPGRRAELGRDALRDLLPGAARLLYVGHVTTGAHALETALHLADGPEARGRAEVVAGAHRPLAAGDIAFGHDARGAWDVPRRVALIACASGADARFAEPTGLASAFVARGAEHVTAARWTLPTEAGLEMLAGRATGAFEAAAVAIDAAHEAEDPVAATCAWQRAEAEAWERTGDAAHAPLVWAAFSTTWAPRRRS